jgi:hypothetical protein
MSATQLAVTIDDISEANAPVIYVKDGLKPFLAAVKEEVSSQVPDLSTAKGRDRIASLAAKVSKSKVAVEKPGREYLKRLKEQPKVVEAELKEFVDAMDALRDETRKPLTDWEAAEIARKDRHVDAIQAIEDLAVDIGLLSAAELRSGIATAEAIQIGDHWQEFEAEAARTKDHVLTRLRAALSARDQYEAEQAELVRLRAEVETQAQRDREAEIARVASEQARIEAEQRAQAERDAAAKREQDLIDQAAAAQRATEQAARDAEAAAERQRLQLQLQAEQAERQAAQAKADQMAAEQQAEQARIAAEQRQAAAVERARQDELDRQAAAVAFELQQAQAREADLAHKKSINRAALEAFVSGGMTEECAKQAITLIAQRKIPAIAITY